MTTETKTLTVKEMDDKGHGLAKIATLSAVDHDGDTYEPGAFSWKSGGEQWAQILPAHNRSAMPLGKARVYEDGDAAFAELHLNLGSEAGKEWHSALKFDLEKGVAIQEWSYGFETIDHSKEMREGQEIRVLKRLDVHEVSTVVRGAGVGTGTLSLKNRGGFAERIDQVIDEIDDIIERAGSIKGLREAEGRPMSAARIEQLARLKAKMDALLSGDDADADVAKSIAQAEAAAAAFFTRDARRRFGR
ncbi:HK97 family phage prohead protease [Pelagibacterium halotolerans]|uniref:Prohead serine protease domain-containing protein n=1 Tax=Pelagibacterium halotolerans (strain DSM 22347 / JCM 15775 / CGMCC 1.7692 / B2) TaxID=1082931 RepID=G4RDD5_PELHB|nr:HK97 family phage prohead protease [Pelagibacterium halotolerans]AEQ50761.1 hypothetical protein KKY_722 [Pelagibacterium halotolerans B2]QJR19319.1 hypothetical protein HKM20_13250 [Pelagibacterium halotolerans]SDZ95114.1 prohead serine protease [Pelagibacterium halotolerans]